MSDLAPDSKPMPPPRSLKLRLALGIGLLALLSSAFISQLASQLSRAQIESDQEALLQTVARGMTKQLAQDMSTRAGEINFLANQDRIRDPAITPAKKREIFERMQIAYPYYAWIGLADPQGNIIAGTGGMLVGKSVAAREWFLQGRQGLHFGDAHDAFLLAKLLPKPKWDDLPLRLVDVSAPVYDPQGQLLGVICGHLSLDWAFEARGALLDQLGVAHPDLIVLNHAGRVLMGTPQLPSLKVDLSTLHAFQTLRQDPVATTDETWPDGRRYLTVAVRESRFRNYPSMGWVVIARRDEQLAFKPANDLSRTIFAGLLLSALAFSVVLWLMLKRYLRPLEQLARAAQQVHAQDLDAPIPTPVGDDEVAVFARSLAELVRALQGRNQDLRLADRIIEESGQGIVITDRAMRILRVNRAFSRITGYSLDEARGSTPALLKSGVQSREFYRDMFESLHAQGRWQGEIWNRNRAGEVYPEHLIIDSLRDAHGEITHFIGIFDDISEKKEYERRLVHLANYDQLTQLPNRNLLQYEAGPLLERARDEGREAALLFVDLDKFKNINDSLGHIAGDAVLTEVAARFRGCIGTGDLLARWGGDEFVIVSAQASRAAVAALAERLIAAMRLPFALDAGSYYLSMSVGIASFPAHGDSVQGLLRCADIAMYRAKEQGANRACFFEPEMNASVERFLRIDTALRHALANGGSGLALAFQPQFDADGVRMLGAEALARWEHAELGSITPTEFIAIAEKTGQIVGFGRWVVEQAVRACAQLRDAVGAALPIAVNFSAQQLHDPGLVESLQQACAGWGVDADAIVVEVTESAIMSDEPRAMQALARLRELGHRISIDDFGTGYSCLTYVQKLRASEIKVDRSFVSTMLESQESRNIIVFTLALAQSMGMEVVAEGVETEAQRVELQRIGPLRLQGYLLARPMPLEALEELWRWQRAKAD
jgi:diguanylate cyclase (GGDEF)-like protein/PAS domain S-box-containing protein